MNVIECRRVVLREWGAGDDESFARELNTPAVMRFLGGVLPAERVAEATGRYRRWQETRGYTFWIVERREDRAFLGFCGLKIADSTGSSVAGALEIGWRFAEHAWGQGFAGEAARGVLAFAFGEMTPERIVAVTLPDNQPSRTLMERLGMRHRPELDYSDDRMGPHPTPAVVYEITRAEWDASQGERES